MKQEKKLIDNHLCIVAICLAFAFLLIGACAAVQNAFNQYHKTARVLIPVTEDIRESIYQENAAFQEMQKDDAAIGNYQDLNINSLTVAEIERLSVDMLKTDNLQILSSFPNLTQLTIKNAEYLSKDDLEWLHQSGIQRISLEVDINTIRNVNTTLPDFSILTDVHGSIRTNVTIDDELELYRFYLLTKAYRKNIVCASLDYKSFDAIDEKIDHILAPFKISDNDSAEVRVIKTALAVCEAIDYDPEVDEYYRTHDFDENDPTIDDLVHFYNQKPLSNTLFHENGYGVCINFSFLFAAAGVKVGLQAYDMHGWANQDREGSHAWNVVRINGQEVPIDLTYLDNRVKGQYSSYHRQLKQYLENIKNGDSVEDNTKTFYDLIFVKLAKEIKDDYMTMRSDCRLEFSDITPIERHIQYYNTSNSSGLYEIRYDDVRNSFLVCGFLPASACLIIYLIFKWKRFSSFKKTNEVP